MKRDIQPLDLILFRGTDAVSAAIGFFERKKSGRGDFSHSGLVVSREVLDLPFLEPGKIYVWESTLTAGKGFWSRFTDKIPDSEGDNVRFGVQLRDFEQVVPAYEGDGGKVAWCRFVGERPPLEETRKTLKDLYDEFGDAGYDADFVDLFAVIFPAMRKVRDRHDRAKERITNHLQRALDHARGHPRAEEAEHSVFCSEWVAIVCKRLGLFEITDPRNAAPTDFVTKLDPSQFEEPVDLSPDDL